MSLQAYKESMYGSRYQWLHWSGRHGLRSQLEYEDDPPHPDGCTREQILTAAEGLLFFGPITLTQTDSYVIPGLSGYVRIILGFLGYRTLNILFC